MGISNTLLAEFAAALDDVVTGPSMNVAVKTESKDMKVEFPVEKKIRTSQWANVTDSNRSLDQTM